MDEKERSLEVDMHLMLNDLNRNVGNKTFIRIYNILRSIEHLLKEERIECLIPQEEVLKLYRQISKALEEKQFEMVDKSIRTLVEEQNELVYLTLLEINAPKRDYYEDLLEAVCNSLCILTK